MYILFIKNYRHFTRQRITYAFEIFKEKVSHIIHEVGKRKICVRY